MTPENFYEFYMMYNKTEVYQNRKPPTFEESILCVSASQKTTHHFNKCVCDVMCVVA